MPAPTIAGQRPPGPEALRFLNGVFFAERRAESVAVVGSLHTIFQSTAFEVARNLTLFFVVVMWLGLAFWVHRDARRRIGDPWLGATATLLGLVPLAGPLAYLLFRPPETLADVKARLSAYLDECGVEGPIVITRNGKAVAVLLVPADDDDLERLLLGRSPRFQALLNRSRQSIKAGKGLSEKEFWAAVRDRARERTAAGRRPKRRR